PCTYFAHITRPPSRRALWDTTVTELLAGIYEPDERGHRPPECLYGATKMWAHLRRQGFPVARCTIERIMRSHGWRGVMRARKVGTTVPGPVAARAPDLVGRCLAAWRPDALWVADLTYVPMAGGGFGYTAFVIDAFAGYIPGWECSLSKSARFVELAIRQAVGLRYRQGHPLCGETVRHSDAGSQYTSVR
ncbi:MAG: IS3 family transposase, partial [Dactylosporangium sp.]|nr:IS3 family transposase [Dactylosporangium sp.]